MSKTKMIKNCGVVILLFFLNSCVDKVSLEWSKGHESTIVIEGVLTNEQYDRDFQKKYLAEKDGNYVRITMSDPANLYDPTALAPDSNSYLVDRTIPVRHAVVWISDDKGQIDTLRADSAQNKGFIGYYTPQKLFCEAGRTYFLNVRIREKLYTASCYMPPVPKLDSVGLVYLRQPVEKFSGFSPLLYFHKPSQEPEFYLTKVAAVPFYTDLNEVPGLAHFNAELSSRIWNYSVLSSTFLPEYVNGLSIPLGATPSTYYVQSLNPGATYEACLFSLTKEAYDYYEALIKSLRNDGGAYSPTPASPPTNIKGGALGFFNASAASTKRFKVPE